MNDYKIKPYVYMVVLGLGCTGSIGFASSVDQNRERIVAAFKLEQQHFNQDLIVAGSLENKNSVLLLEQLLALHLKHPQDQKIIADYLLLSQEADRVDQTLRAVIDKIEVKTFPGYAQTTLIQVLRDLKQFPLAISYVQRFAQQDSSQNWAVYAAVLQAEAGQISVAKQALAQLNQQALAARKRNSKDFGAEQLMQMSYAYRLVKMPVEALHYAQQAMLLQSQQGQINQHFQDQYIQSLILNSGFVQAKQYVMDAGMQQQFPYLLAQLELGDFRQRIQNTVQRYKILSYKNQGGEAYQALDEVLQQMADFEAQWIIASTDTPQAIRQQFYYDYIYALNQRNQSQQVFEQLLKLDHPVENMPAYVRHSVADAALKTRQPQRAELLYASLQTEKNYMDYNVYAGWYYSLIEQERFREAAHLLTQMDQVLPKLSYSEASGVDHITHDDRIDYLVLKGLNLVYRNQHAQAEQYFRDLVETAPNHQSIQNALALVLRWREKPQQSDRVLAQLNGMTPVQQATQINQLQNRQAREDIPAWRQQEHDLMQRVPEDTGVLLSHKQLGDRDHASIQHQSTFSRSQSNADDILLQGLNGVRERQQHTRLNTPWFADHYRIWVDHQYRWSDYSDRHLSDQRAGLGIEWASKGKYLGLLLNQGLDTSRSGVDLNWAQRLNDHWEYALGFSSQAALPLQAFEDGVHGQSYLAALNWQANESRQVGLNYQWTDSSDDNLRQEAGAYARQRIFQAPHHLTDVQISGYWGRNRDIDTAYFNPARSHSVELSLFHDWMTWRNYDRHFSQHFELTVGRFAQKNYDNKPIYAALYRHDWRVSRTWELQYGVGWQQHPYDGQNEKNTYAMLGFEGRF